MAAPVKEMSLGHCKAAVFKSEQYNSYSVKFQKSYKNKEGNWQNSEYFNFTDLRDLYALVGSMLMKQVKERIPGQKAPEAPQTASEPVGDDTVPF